MKRKPETISLWERIMSKAKEEDPDLSAFSQRYIDIREERDLLRAERDELQIAHKISESKVETLTTENTLLKSQLDAFKAKVVEKETVIQGIAATILTHVKKNDAVISSTDSLRAVERALSTTPLLAVASDSKK